MKLTIIGCGDAFGSGGRHHSAYRLDAGGRSVLIDFGASAIVGWKQRRFDSNDIDAVILSHLHGDHFGGLPFLLLEAHFVGHRQRPLPIYGPPGTGVRLRALLEILYPDVPQDIYGFEWPIMELMPGEAEIQGVTVRTVELLHPSGAPAYGFRLAADGKAFAYSGDTGWTERLYELSDGTDLFVIECSSAERRLPMHLDWPQLRAHLAAFGSKRIVLTHLGEMALDLAGEMNAAGVDVAADGDVYDFR